MKCKHIIFIRYNILVFHNNFRLLFSNITHAGSVDVVKSYKTMDTYTKPNGVIIGGSSTTHDLLLLMYSERDAMPT